MRRLCSVALVAALLSFVAPDAFAHEGEDKVKPQKSSAAAAPAPASATAPASEEEDKRALVLALDIGFAHADLGSESSLGFDKSAANGGVYGAGAGMRFDKLRVGGRFRSHATTEFNLWSLLLEVGYGLKLKPLKPAFFLHGGWLWSTSIEKAVFASSLPALNFLAPDARVHGPTVGLEAQALFHPVKEAGIGPFVGFDLVFLQRPQIGLPQSVIQIPQDIREKPLYTESGSSTGWILQIGIRGALELGI